MWVLLAALGVPTWLIVGAVVGALWSRGAHRRAPGAFPCKVRTVSGADGPRRWARSTSYARWVHDVLLVHSGMPLLAYRALPVREADTPVALTESVRLKGEGDPIGMRVTLDDGTVAEVATTKAWVHLLAGPF